MESTQAPEKEETKVEVKETKVEATYHANGEFIPILTTLNDAYHDTNGNIKLKHIPRFKNIVSRFK
jgi:hypothetical protein